jgi:uncharacterized protein YqjF (DUF2071 family)
MDHVQTVLRADWERALFVHFEVDAEPLARVVPFELDLYEGPACVSLVAFTQNNLRPTRGGRIAALLSRPLARHAFLNLRAYVRVNGEPAIFFIAEWIPNRLATLLGPRLYGLPYKIGSLDYRSAVIGDETRLLGRVAAAGRCLQYRAVVQTDADAREAAPGTGVNRRFRVAHAPWPQARAEIEITDRTLLTAQGDWLGNAELLGANYALGVRDVDISAPQVVNSIAKKVFDNRDAMRRASSRTDHACVAPA